MSFDKEYERIAYLEAENERLRARIAYLEAENERLRAREAEARTLILSASLFMPSYPSAEGRLDWIRSSQKWLDATQSDMDKAFEEWRKKKWGAHPYPVDAYTFFCAGWKAALAAQSK